MHLIREGCECVHMCDKGCARTHVSLLPYTSTECCGAAVPPVNDSTVSTALRVDSKRCGDAREKAGHSFVASLGRTSYIGFVCPGDGKKACLKGLTMGRLLSTIVVYEVGAEGGLRGACQGTRQ